MFHVWCVLHNFSFCKTAEEYEGSVMHIEVVPSTLMRVNVYDYPMYLVCGFSYFWGFINYETVEAFYKNVWGNSIAIGKEN